MSRSLSPAHPLAPPVGSRFDRRCATFEHVFGLPAKTFLDALAEISPDFARHRRHAGDFAGHANSQVCVRLHALL